MPALLRPALTALGVACLLSAASLASSGTAFAQAKQQPAPAQQAAPAQQQAPTLKQIALTDKQLDGVLAAQKDMDVITEKLPENTAPEGGECKDCYNDNGVIIALESEWHKYTIRFDWLLQRPIDILVVELGGNDGLRGLDLKTMKTNLQAMSSLRKGLHHRRH